jgi:allantoinase
MNDLGIKGNKICTPDGIRPAVVLIKDGRIAEVISPVPNELPIDVVDIQESVLMAGVIDPHVHINEPGRTDWEGFNTATRAALAGGLTTLIDMPLTQRLLPLRLTLLTRRLLLLKGNCIQTVVSGAG